MTVKVFKDEILSECYEINNCSMSEMLRQLKIRMNPKNVFIVTDIIVCPGFRLNDSCNTSVLLLA